MKKLSIRKGNRSCLICLLFCVTCGQGGSRINKVASNSFRIHKDSFFFLYFVLILHEFWFVLVALLLTHHPLFQGSLHFVHYV